MHGVVRYQRSVTPKSDLESHYDDIHPSDSNLSQQYTAPDTSSSLETCTSDNESRIYMDIDVLCQFEPSKSREVHEMSTFWKLFYRLRRFFRRRYRNKHQEDSPRSVVPNTWDITYQSIDL